MFPHHAFSSLYHFNIFACLILLSSEACVLTLKMFYLSLKALPNLIIKNGSNLGKRKKEDSEEQLEC